MALKYSELKAKIIRLLADESNEDTPLAGASRTAEMLQDAVHAALDAITARVWLNKYVDITQTVSEADLPEDLINVEGVFDNKLGVLIPKLSLVPGREISSTVGNAWFLFPSRKISFINDVPTEGVRVYYAATFAKPTKDTDVIDAPSNTYICLVLFAASYCLLQDAASSANIRQFNTRIDSGQPTDIPAKAMSDFLLKRFEQELQRLPLVEKSRTQ